MAINTTYEPNFLALAQTPLPRFILILLTNYYRWELQIHPRCRHPPAWLSGLFLCMIYDQRWKVLHSLVLPLISRSLRASPKWEHTSCPDTAADLVLFLKEAFQYLPIPSPTSTAASEIYQFFFFLQWAVSHFWFAVLMYMLHFLKTWSICHTRKTGEGRTWCCAHFTTLSKIFLIAGTICPFL